MKATDIIQITLTVIAVVLIPFLVFVVRKLIHDARMEAKLDTAIQDLAELMKNKDATHAAMLDQMKYDRDATDKKIQTLQSSTDRRLRFLEEYVWRTTGAARRRRQEESGDSAA